MKSSTSTRLPTYQVRSTTRAVRATSWWETRLAFVRMMDDGRALSLNAKVCLRKKTMKTFAKLFSSRSEIRCLPPEIPKNSSVVYNGNDRSFSDSFKVGSTVQYRCSQGHIVQGQSLRTCETSGHWSEAPPICVCKCPFTIQSITAFSLSLRVSLLSFHISSSNACFY